jgi:PAS domain S-box-containing protein
MNDSKHPSRDRLTTKRFAAIIIATTIIVGVLDFYTSAQLVGSVLFTFPLALCAMQDSKRLLWGIAGAAAALTVAAELTGANRTGLVGPEFELINRGLLIASLLTLTIIIHLWINRAREINRITVEKDRESRRLADTTQFLNNVLESSTEYSIIAADLDGGILIWNEGARRNYGYTSEEMVGRANLRVLHTSEDIDSGRVQALFDATLETGNASAVLERRRKSGTLFTAQLAMALRRDAVGTPTGYLMISSDISQRIRLEREVERKNAELEGQYYRVQHANRLKSEFLANMSHELRTPLNAIIGFSELMYDGKAGEMSPHQKEYTGDVLASARHLLQLINDVLDLAKIEAGKMEFHPEPVNLPKIVNEVCDVVRTLVAAKRLDLRIDIAAGLADLVLDAGKLKQVLYNYLSNAIKFSNEGGEITVHAMPEGEDHFLLDVRDTGIGIKADDLARLFLEFEQLDTGRSKQSQGTGLGLALTQRIVEAQGGRVGVESEPNQGSRFWVVLPRRTGSGELHAPQLRSHRVRSGAPVVLVVDDDSRDRAQIEAALSLAGFAVETASNGSRAIAMCREQVFAGITLDLLLPDTNGWQVLSAIREQGLNIRTPVIVVSVVVDKAAVAVFDAQDRLVKPFQPAELIDVLRHHGVRAPPARSVLLVDDDLAAVAVLRKRLESEGYRTLHAATAAEARKMLDAQNPDAAVITVQMASGGLELIEQIRLSGSARGMAVIVTTRHDLRFDELEKLQRESLPVVAKGENAGEAVVSALRARLAQSLPILLEPAA